MLCIGRNQRFRNLHLQEKDAVCSMFLNFFRQLVLQYSFNCSNMLAHLNQVPEAEYFCYLKKPYSAGSVCTKLLPWQHCLLLFISSCELSTSLFPPIPDFGRCALLYELTLSPIFLTCPQFLTSHALLVFQLHAILPLGHTSE